jgi:hypothetical protein
MVGHNAEPPPTCLDKLFNALHHLIQLDVEVSGEPDAVLVTIMVQVS